MRSITIEELERIDREHSVVIDIRPKDQYDRGTFPGAVSIPAEKFDKEILSYEKDTAIYVLCHTGERSQEYVHLLEQ